MMRRVNPERFVSALKEHVFDFTVEDIVGVRRDGPPGRQPSTRGVALHDWFAALTADDQAMVTEITPPTQWRSRACRRLRFSLHWHSAVDVSSLRRRAPRSRRRRLSASGAGYGAQLR